MSKKIIFIPILCSAAMLTGCFNILSSVASTISDGGDISQPTFSAEGDETTAEKFSNALDKDLEDLGLNYVANETSYKSFVASIKAQRETHTSIKDSKNKYRGNESNTTKNISDIKYSRDSKVLAFEQTYTVKATYSGGNTTNEDNQTTKHKGQYQYEYSNLVLTDDVVKEYTDAYVPASIDGNHQMDYLIYSEIGSFVNLIMSYTSSAMSKNCRFYRNDKVYTVEYSEKKDNSTSYSEDIVTYKNKAQLNLGSKAMTLKYTSESNRNTDVNNSSYSADDKRSITTKEYGTATLEYKEPNLKSVDLSGYTKEA